MTHMLAGWLSVAGPLAWQFVTSDFGLGLLALLVFVLVIRPLWRRNWRTRQILQAANEVFHLVEQWAEKTGYRGEAKLYQFLKLLSDRVDNLSAEEAEMARKWAQAQAARTPPAPPTDAQ